MHQENTDETFCYLQTMALSSIFVCLLFEHKLYAFFISTVMETLLNKVVKKQPSKKKMFCFFLILSPDRMNYSVEIQWKMNQFY